jgi:carbon monoxide dehydrogenase subunit G
VVTVSRTFPVDKPVDVVIDYLKDFSHAVEWDPGTQSCERVGTDSLPIDAPITVGTTWRNISKVLGRSTELSYRLEVLEAGHLTLVGTNKTATSTDDITVVAAGSGSVVTYRAQIVFHGLARLSEPLMKLEFERLGTLTRKQIAAAIAAL